MANNYGKYAVIGLGQFGIAVSKELARRGAEVLAIDKDDTIVKSVKPHVAEALTMDATNLEVLQMQNLNEMDAVLVSIGESSTEGLLFATVHLLEIGVKRIISRAMNAQQRLILEKLGIEDILSPENEVGILVAESLINPFKKRVMPLPDGVEIADIIVPPKLIKKPLGEVNLEKNYKLQLIAIKRFYEEYNEGERQIIEHLIRYPNSDTVVQPGDEFVIMGKAVDIEKLIHINA